MKSPDRTVGPQGAPGLGGDSSPRRAPLVLLVVVGLMGVGVMALSGWGRIRDRVEVEARYLEGLNVELNGANAALAAATDSARARVRSARLFHEWLERGGSAGSAGLVEALDQLARPVVVAVPRTVFDDMVATDRFPALADPELRRDLLRLYRELRRLETRPTPALEAYRQGLDEHLPLGTWLHLEGESVRGVPLDFKKTVADLHEAGFKTEIRGVLREYSSLEKELVELHGKTVDLWSRARQQRNQGGDR